MRSKNRRGTVSFAGIQKLLGKSDSDESARFSGNRGGVAFDHPLARSIQRSGGNRDHLARAGLPELHVIADFNHILQVRGIPPAVVRNLKIAVRDGDRR